MKARRGSTGPLDEDEKVIVEQYGRFLKDVPGPLTVWVTTDDGVLHFHTLVLPGKEKMRAVFRAETKLMRAIDPLVVDFDVYDRPESVRERVGSLSPVLKRD